MPTNFEQALGVIDQVVAGYPAGFNDNALTYFPDFVEVYGQDEAHLDLSIKNWYGKNEYTNWIVKHGCRTLLKKGNKAALDIFGFADTNQEKTKGFHLMAQSLSIGEALSFLFTILAKETTKIRLEYGIDYVKASGRRSRKIFQIFEILLQASQEKLYVKAHSFADISSRKHYPGIHPITLIVNGIARETLDFEVLATR